MLAGVAVGVELVDEARVLVEELRLLVELELDELEDVVVVELVDVVVETLVLVVEPDVTVDEPVETEALAVPWKLN